ncbi:MAG: hypothetical protein GXO70_06995 [Acidobacteria bacterium]|nr:hypothetical protein [Acidobacteriota bacterium]
MKKSLLFLMVLTLATFGFGKTRHLGNYSYINTDGAIHIAVNAAVAAKNLNRKYLPFIAYMGCAVGKMAVVERKSIVLEYKGNEYHLPTMKELRQNYNRDVMDMTLFAREIEHIFPSEMSNYRYQPWIDFCPARTEPRKLAPGDVTLTSSTGVKTKLYFKNPGIKKGDTAVLKVVDKKNPDINGSITIKF